MGGEALYRNKYTAVIRDALPFETATSMPKLLLRKVKEINSDLHKYKYCTVIQAAF
jgi:hypothetical protein